MASTTTDAATTEQPSPYVIQGREVRLPVDVRDATAAVAYYLVSSSAAQKLIEPTGLRVAQVFPGRTFCTIGTIDYRDGDLGRYHEIAVTFFVRERGALTVPFMGTVLGLIRGSLASHIHQLPVDGEFTCEAGQTIWGFPKFMSEITLSTRDDMQTSVLSADGQHVLTHSVRMGGTRAFGDRSLISYAYRDGVLYKTPSVMRGEGVGARLGGAKLELGTHPIADELRTLGLPSRAIFSTFVTKMSGTFYAAEAR